MRKLIAVVIFLYCYIVVLATGVKAFEFTKSKNNPLNISYINGYFYPLQAHIYKNDSKCQGILTAKKSNDSYYSLVKIESDNCLDWVMTKEILNIGQEISDPRLFVDSDGSKKIFFTKKDGNDFYRIYSTDCDNALNCSSNIKLVLDPNKLDYQESHGYFASYVIKNENSYYMFYGVWGSDGFKIRMAYSDNLNTWQKCPNNLLSDGSDGPFPYIVDNNLYLFYHKSDASGIKLAKSSLPLSCNLQFEDMGYKLKNDTNYDRNHLIFPSVIEDNGLKIYYTGLGGNWTLNLACEGQSCPTPITPTSTITPTPTKTPMIIIPGFMASWNKKAIIHNEEVSIYDWKILSFIKEYTGIITSLKNLGYKENEDLFIFAYDWRQPIEKISDNLRQFINEKINTKSKVNIVGHSLGGIVGRIYSQKYLSDNRVNKIVSVGSPHQGVVQVYKPVFFGDIDRENSFLWLTEKIILMLNKKFFESDKEIINNKFPVLKDILPIFNFLKNSSGEEIDINSLLIKNQTLNQYHSSFSSIYNIFSAVYGEKTDQTPSGFVVDKNNYPISKLFSVGDYTVLSNSAYEKEDNDYQKLELDHGELIYKKNAIKKIFDLLDINYQDEQIVEGQKTVISPSLVFLIKSPATMELETNQGTVNEEEGIIFLPDVQQDVYTLNVKGKDYGQYTLIIGQITESNDVWKEITGEINKTPPDSQIDSYQISMIIPSPTPTPIPTMFLTLTLTPTVTLTASPTSALSPTNTVSSLVNSVASSNSSFQSLPNSTPTPTITYFSSLPESNVLGVKTTEIPSKTVFTPTPTLINKKTNRYRSIFFVIALTIGAFSYFFHKQIFRLFKS